MSPVRIKLNKPICNQANNYIYVNINNAYDEIAFWVKQLIKKKEFSVVKIY